MKLAAATMVVVVLVLIAAVLIRRKTMNDVPALFAQLATDKSDYDAKVADQATKDAAAAQADSDAAAAKMKLLQTRDALIAAINQAYTPA